MYKVGANAERQLQSAAGRTVGCSGVWLGCRNEANSPSGCWGGKGQLSQVVGSRVSWLWPARWSYQDKHLGHDGSQV